MHAVMKTIAVPLLVLSVSFSANAELTKAFLLRLQLAFEQIHAVDPDFYAKAVAFANLSEARYQYVITGSNSAMRKTV